MSLPEPDALIEGPVTFPLSAEVKGQYHRFVISLWRNGIGPVEAAVPMPPRTLATEPFAAALRALAGHISPLGEIMEHIRVSGPDATIKKLLARGDFSRSHIHLGCGLVLVTWMTYNTMGRLHSPRLVGLLTYAPALHPAWPATFRPSPSSTRCIMGHLAQHIQLTADITVQSGRGVWIQAPTHTIWSELLNVCIPPAHFDKTETPAACRSLSDGVDTLTALGLLPLASFSVDSPSASPKVLRSLLAAGCSAAVESAIAEQLLGDFLMVPPEAACLGRSQMARDFCAALIQGAQRFPAAEQRVTFFRAVGLRIGLGPDVLTPPRHPPVELLAAAMHAPALQLRRGEWHPPPTALSSGILAPLVLIENTANDLLQRFPAVIDEFMDPQALLSACWEHAMARARTRFPFDQPDLRNWSEWGPTCPEARHGCA
jgi:hypothetical protein